MMIIMITMMMMTTLGIIMMQPSVFKLNGEAVMQLPRMIVLEAAIEAMMEVAMSHHIQPTSSEELKSTTQRYQIFSISLIIIRINLRLEGSNLREAELMQYRCPVGLGPSSNTCPRCAPHWKRTGPKKMKMKWYKYNLLYFLPKIPPWVCVCTVTVMWFPKLQTIQPFSLKFAGLNNQSSSINYSLNNHHVKKVKPILDTVNKNPDCPWVLSSLSSGPCTLIFVDVHQVTNNLYSALEFLCYQFNIFTSHFLGIEGLNLALESWPLSYSILQHTKELQAMN